MPLDAKTLLVSSLSICALLGAASLGFGLRRPEHRAVRHWGAGLLALAAGLALAALNGWIPDSLAVTLAHVALGYAALAFEQSARALRGRDERDIPGWAVLLAYFVVLHVSDGFAQLRVGTLAAASVVPALLLVRAAYAFDRGAPREETAPLRSLACVLGLAGLALLARGPADAVTLAVLGPGLLGCSVALAWLLATRAACTAARLGAHDALTGALNDRALLEAFRREASRAGRSNACFALALLDVDHLKRVNDAHGHAAGDAALAALADTVRKSVREYDVLGRHGGDEFVLVLPGVLAEGACALAERVRKAVERNVAGAAQLRKPLTASLGVALSAGTGESWDAMFRAAEAALFAAKRAGGNRVVLAGSGDGPQDTSTTRFPSASGRATLPGSSTVVQSSCSTIAGPSNSAGIASR
jgi:diguanylate cyclase (GGDEF)-like protein